jgi:Ni/Fe-hydrogenase subunit HybB-like protein
VRQDAALLLPGAPTKVHRLYAWLARGWDAPGQGLEHSGERREQIAPALVVAYVLCMSLLAFDLIMSLAPHWLSNLLGGFFFMGAWLSGLMALALLAVFWRRHFELQELITTKHLHDLGKLCFGFTVFWAYLFFSQFLVIWYGNLPEETSFLFLRMAADPWREISAAMVVLVFVVPFWGLISVSAKKTPAILSTFAVISLLGLWVDRYVLTVPSVVQRAASLPLGWQEVAVTAGFAGLWGLAYLWFAERFPLVSPSLVEHGGERRRHPHASYD